MLMRLGADVLLYDEKADPETICGRFSEGACPRVMTGALDVRETGKLDLAVLSPGVPTDIPQVLLFHKMGIPVWGEVELAYEASRGRVLAITGTNG